MCCKTMYRLDLVALSRGRPAYHLAAVRKRSGLGEAAEHQLATSAPRENQNAGLPQADPADHRNSAAYAAVMRAVEFHAMVDHLKRASASASEAAPALVETR